MSLEGQLWEASEEKLYGSGAGCAHPSVEWVPCPTCGARVGQLCREDNGEPKLSRHYRRCSAFRALRQIWKQAGLEDAALRPTHRRSRAELRRLIDQKRRRSSAL